MGFEARFVIPADVGFHGVDDLSDGYCSPITRIEEFTLETAKKPSQVALSCELALRDIDPTRPAALTRSSQLGQR